MRMRVTDLMQKVDDKSGLKSKFLPPITAVPQFANGTKIEQVCKSKEALPLQHDAHVPVYIYFPKLLPK